MAPGHKSFISEFNPVVTESSMSKGNHLKTSNNVPRQPHSWESVKVSGHICFSCKGLTGVFLKGL